MKHSCQYGDFQLMASKVKSAMEDERFIPFVPRSIRHAAKLATQLCERTLDILAPGLASALDPFPEARRALAFAFMDFAKTQENP